MNISLRQMDDELRAAKARIASLEESLAKYQACRVHDVDEKNWLRDRVNVLGAELAHKESYYAQFYLVPKTAAETAVNPTMQHAPDCPILRGKECLCDPYPLNRQVKP